MATLSDNDTMRMPGVAERADITAPERQSRSGISRTRLFDVDRAKGFAIVLVVIGHVAAGALPAGNAWYAKLLVAIYVFHMPFFMYLAGIIFAYTRPPATMQNYGRYLAKRANRLLVPFVALGLAVLIAKLVARNFLYIDKVPGGLLDGLIALVWDTNQSPAIAVWFLFVLFCYCAVTPLLLSLTNGRLWPIFLLAAGLHFVPCPALVYGDRLCYFYLYFMIGVAYGRSVEAWQSFIDRTYPLFCAVFVAGTAFILIHDVFDRVSDLAVVVTSLASLPAFHGLIRARPFNRSTILLWLGDLALAIYLFNTLFIGLTKALLLLVLKSWDGANFLIFFPLLASAGLFGPIALKYWVLNRVPMLRQYTE